MALILYDKDYVFTEDIVLKNKDTKQPIFEYTVKINDEEAQEIKAMLKKKETNEEDDTRLKEIFYKDRLNELIKQIGEFKVDEFTDMILGSFLGKLGSNRQKNFSYATSKYLKTTKR